VLFLIFTLLTPNSMRSACLVSHQWHQVRSFLPPPLFYFRSLSSAQALTSWAGGGARVQVAKDNWTWKALCEKEELTMNSANRRKYGDDWLAWYRALVRLSTAWCRGRRPYSASSRMCS
jgi:hypothetical protein